MLQNNFYLREMNDQDLDIFKEWLYLPHVSKWYEHPEDWISEYNEKEKYDFIKRFILQDNDKSIGFCQYYDYKKGEEDWHGDISLENTFSIDYMIGDINYLHKKVGTKLVNLLVEKIKENEKMERIIVCPDVQNNTSCNTLLSAGFKYDKKNKLYILERK